MWNSLKKYYQVKTKVKYEHINISDSTETKLLELIIDETLSWNQPVDQIGTKLCSACFAVRNLKYIVPQCTLKKFITLIYILQGVQLKRGPCFNMSNVFTKLYNILYYTTNLYLQ
jgi:hypothetical protein